MQDSETANGENGADTLWRVASGPGADLSCLRQIPAPGPRKVMVRAVTCFSTGVFSVVCGFSSKLVVKKRVMEEIDGEKDIKFRNH